MTVVKALVKSGITICATIHSPTPYCFNLFDTLMILLRGHVVYFGENGARLHAARLDLLYYLYSVTCRCRWLMRVEGSVAAAWESTAMHEVS